MMKIDQIRSRLWPYLLVSITIHTWAAYVAAQMLKSSLAPTDRGGTIQYVAEPGPHSAVSGNEKLEKSTKEQGPPAQSGQKQFDKSEEAEGMEDETQPIRMAGMELESQSSDEGEVRVFATPDPWDGNDSEQDNSLKSQANHDDAPDTGDTVVELLNDGSLPRAFNKIDTGSDDLKPAENTPAFSRPKTQDPNRPELSFSYVGDKWRLILQFCMLPVITDQKTTAVVVRGLDGPYTPSSMEEFEKFREAYGYAGSGPLLSLGDGRFRKAFKVVRSLNFPLTSESELCFVALVKESDLKRIDALANEQCVREGISFSEVKRIYVELSEQHGIRLIGLERKE